MRTGGAPTAMNRSVGNGVRAMPPGMGITSPFPSVTIPAHARLVLSSLTTSRRLPAESTSRATISTYRGWRQRIGFVPKPSSRYDDKADTFILSGVEDLVPVQTTGETTRYRPRTEGVFARSHVKAARPRWALLRVRLLGSVLGAQPKRSIRAAP